MNRRLCFGNAQPPSRPGREDLRLESKAFALPAPCRYACDQPPVALTRAPLAKPRRQRREPPPGARRTVLPARSLRVRSGSMCVERAFPGTGGQKISVQVLRVLE